MQISIGRIVIYVLTAEDAQKINRRRTSGAAIAERIESATWPIGAQAHIGNDVSEGYEFPMIVTKNWGGSVNAQVLLDGNDCLWVCSVQEGTAPGSWHWPPKIVN